MKSKHALETASALALLERMIPFRFLTQEQRMALLPDLVEHRFEAGQTPGVSKTPGVCLKDSHYA